MREALCGLGILVFQLHKANEMCYIQTYLMYWATHLNPSLNPILRTTEHM